MFPRLSLLMRFRPHRDKWKTTKWWYYRIRLWANTVHERLLFDTYSCTSVFMNAYSSENSRMKSTENWKCFLFCLFWTQSDTIIVRVNSTVLQSQIMYCTTLTTLRYTRHNEQGEREWRDYAQTISDVIRRQSKKKFFLSTAMHWGRETWIAK